MVVKQDNAGDSLGIDVSILVYYISELEIKLRSIMEEYGPLLVEEYISGREFTIMIAAAADPNEAARTFKPVEYIFPAGTSFVAITLILGPW